MVPVKIRQSSASELRIDWDDGHRSRHVLKTLRDQCPCASCKGEREGNKGELLPILTPGQYELKGMEPVGSYALQMHWGDGHRTGIYTYEYLRYLRECEICMKAAVNG
jgi:DUF971 family protein